SRRPRHRHRPHPRAGGSRRPALRRRPGGGARAGSRGARAGGPRQRGPVSERPAGRGRFRARRRLLRPGGLRGRRGRLEPHRPVRAPSPPGPSRRPSRPTPIPGAQMTTPRTDEVPLWNIANILTMVRCAMVPLLVVLAIMFPDSVPGRLLVAAVFVIAMITDFLDGYLARSRNLITDFGKLVDPIADKAMTGAALIMLSVW